MDDDLIDAAASPERASLLPGEGFFVPDSVEADREASAAAEALAGADVAVVADPDADGLGCVALLREVHDEVALIDAGPHELATGLEHVAEHAEPGLALYVCDLCPDSLERIEASLATLAERTRAIRWFDHHQWDDDVAAAVRDYGVDLAIGVDDEECTVDVALRSLDADLPDRFAELAAVTRDHDLWIKEDPRSDDLADYATWADPESYVATVRDHGVDLPEDVRSFLAERRVEKEERIQRAVRRADHHEVGPYTVGVTYGRCSQNEVAEALREAGADAAVIVKPAGSASLRGSAEFERCHEVAGLVNGGGHPRAAGCKPDIYDDMLDYAHHWTTQGAAAKRAILEAFRAVVEGRGQPSATQRSE